MYFGLSLLFCGVVLFEGNDGVCDDTEDECASDGSDGDLTECYCKSADTADQDDCDYEEVLVFTKVNFLDHLKTGDCDESVESDANAAHYAVRDRCEECYEGTEEGYHDRHYSGSEDGHYGSVTCDSYATGGLAVCGVGASAEDSACDGADTVTEKSSVETGLFKEVFFNDGGEVLVVCDVLCEYYECNGDVGDCDCCYVTAVDVLDALDTFDEGEVGDVEEAHVSECAEVDYLESCVVCCKTDNCEDRCCSITCEDTDDEGDEFRHLLAEYGADDDYQKCDKSAEKCDMGVSCGFACCSVEDLTFCEVAYCIACEGETDDGNCGADNACGHQLVDPLDTCYLNYDSDDYVDETCEYSTDDESEVSYLHGECTCECGHHGTDECKAGAEEHGASELSEEEVNEGTDACSEESCCLVHSVTYDSGYCDCCGKYCEKLLESEDDYFAEIGSVFYSVNEFHVISSVSIKNNITMRCAQ